jgi:hypothetical protein
MKLSSMAAGGTAIDVEHFGRSGHRTALLLYIRALSEVSKITIDIEFLERGLRREIWALSARVSSQSLAVSLASRIFLSHAG